MNDDPYTLHESENGDLVGYDDYLTAIAQRDAAVRERAECVAREQRWLARLAACEQKNERVMSIARRLALRSGFAAQALSELEAEGIDRAAVATPDDDGPNDGHARTVNRTPPQEATSDE
jgi:hypothetical protein